MHFYNIRYQRDDTTNFLIILVVIAYSKYENHYIEAKNSNLTIINKLREINNY